MNNDEFKKFVTPYVDEMIVRLGGFEYVRAAYEQIPDGISHFIAGGVYGLVAKMSLYAAPWREEQPASFIPLQLNQEEVRRVLDLVRLRVETESATS